jgi:hypothetical protein
MTNIASTTTKNRLHLKALKARIALKGLAAIDSRTSAARHLISWRDELITALGGDPTPQQLALIELCTRARAILDHVDNYVLSLDSLVNKRGRKLVPIVSQRTALADHLSKLLAQLGLSRIARDSQTLEGYLASKGQTIERVERSSGEETIEDAGESDDNRSNG